MDSRAQKLRGEKNGRTAARRLKAHYGFWKKWIKSAGRSSARKAVRRSPAMAILRKQKPGRKISPAKCTRQKRGLKVRFESVDWIVLELRARTANLILVWPCNTAFCSQRPYIWPPPVWRNPPPLAPAQMATVPATN